MAEYIDKKALKKSVEERYCEPCKTEGKDHNGCLCRACWVDDMLDEVECSQSADVAPVVHGHWVDCNGEIVDWDENNHGCPRHSCFCSICKSWLTASDEFPVIAYFCPNCGAKMDGGDSDEVD